MLRSPVIASVCCLVGAAVLLAAAEPAAARRRGQRQRRAVRVGMLVQTLPPTWTRSTMGREVVLDAEPEHVPPPIRIRSTRASLTRRACYRALGARGIKFKPGPNKGGLIAFPVIVRGKIGGVYYQNKYSRAPMLADCQLVLTLYRAAAVFRKYGIVRVLWSNTWRKPYWNFKLRRSMPARGRRLGNHPRGLAMDASVLVDKKGVKYVVQPDWEKFYGGPGNCVGRPKTKKGSLLRRVTCTLEKHHIFRRILTPDSNWGHRHHFHFTAPRVNEAFVRRRWCGRTLHQPLPGTRSFKKYSRWVSCYKIRHASKRWHCYKKHARGPYLAPVKYKRPKAKPKVALRLIVPIPQAQPDAGSRHVELKPSKRIRPRRRKQIRPRRRRRRHQRRRRHRRRLHR